MKWKGTGRKKRIIWEGEQEREVHIIKVHFVPYENVIMEPTIM